MKVIHINQYFFAILITAILLLATPVLAKQNTDSDQPEKITNHLQDALLRAMREGEQLGYQGRFDFLSPIINQSHDLDYIIRAAMGSYWSQFTDDQKKLITDTFCKLSIATYAGRFNQFDDEKFEITEERELPRNQILIRSRLIKTNGKMFNFDYVFHNKEDHWRIVNIVVDGVSDLALKRVEYRSVMQRDGFSALIDMLKEKIVLAQEP